MILNQLKRVTINACLLAFNRHLQVSRQILTIEKLKECVEMQFNMDVFLKDVEQYFFNNISFGK